VLFNDGVGIVVFTALLAFATGIGDADPLHAIAEVAIQALGSLIFGVLAAQLRSAQWERWMNSPWRSA